MLILAAVFILPVYSLPDYTILKHLQFGILSGIVVSLCAVYPPTLLANALARKTGLVSYSMYLVHFALLWPSLEITQKLISGDGWPTACLHFGVLVTLTFGVSLATYSMIEQPFIRWAASRKTDRRMTLRTEEA